MLLRRPPRQIEVEAVRSESFELQDGLLALRGEADTWRSSFDRLKTALQVSRDCLDTESKLDKNQLSNLSQKRLYTKVQRLHP